MDAKDKNLLGLLQNDATLSIAELAKRVHLSNTACWKRVQRLTDNGTIKKHVCVLDQDKVGVGVTVFVAIKTSQHETDWLEKFAESVRDIPEIVEFYRLSGDIDYLLKVVVPSIEGFDQVYKRLISTVEIFNVSSSFSMEELKYTTAIPLDYC